MNRKGYLSTQIATHENFSNAYWGYSAGKHGRREVRLFEADLDENLANLLHAYATRTWRTSPYVAKEVFYPKHRTVHKSAVPDHTIQWAALLPVERWLMDTFYYRSPACVPGKGTHFFVRQEMQELTRCSQAELYYLVQLDIHHYFLNIDHQLMSLCIRKKIKDPILLHFIDEFINSFLQGIVLGVKLSQLLSGLYLAPFDRIALNCFGIADDPEKYRYWQSRYVTDSIVTCRTAAEAADINRGVEYLNQKFDNFVRRGLYSYSRFADNIVIKHSDKVFLRLMVELAIMTLTRDFLLPVNKNWAIRPTWMGNDLCGYVFYHDRLMLRKKNKKALCRQVAKLRKKGLTDREIELACASRVGFAIHAQTRHLLKKLNMEKRLGAVIRNRRKKAPFEGMTAEQKRSVEDLICLERDNEEDKLILLIDYKVEDSVIEKNDDGSCKQRIAIRYKKVDQVNSDGEETTYTWHDEEYYSFSGSRIMIEQALNDFSQEDLPLVTAIKEFVNKQRKKFYKFT